MSQQLDIFKFEEELKNQNRFVQPQSIQDQGKNSSEHQNNFQTNNQLTLQQRPSIQNVIPIPQNMLSEDPYQLQNEQYHQGQSNNPKLQKQVMLQQLILELGLDQLINVHHETFPDNTKNVLRNLGNALHHFIFYHKRARQIIENTISSPRSFDQWVRKLKMENFDNFKNIWASQNKKLFTKVYKKLSWIFYSENSIPYILSSRIRKTKTKYSHLKHLYRFLQGIKQPQTFTYFKKIVN